MAGGGGGLSPRQPCALVYWRLCLGSGFASGASWLLQVLGQQDGACGCWRRVGGVCHSIAALPSCRREQCMVQQVCSRMPQGAAILYSAALQPWGVRPSYTLTSRSTSEDGILRINNVNPPSPAGDTHLWRDPHERGAQRSMHTAHTALLHLFFLTPPPAGSPAPPPRSAP